MKVINLNMKPIYGNEERIELENCLTLKNLEVRMLYALYLECLHAPRLTFLQKNEKGEKPQLHKQMTIGKYLKTYNCEPIRT